MSDVVLPGDVLAATMAMLCALLTITHAGDLKGREAYFDKKPATVRMLGINHDTIKSLMQMTTHLRGVIDSGGGGVSDGTADQFFISVAGIGTTRPQPDVATEDWPFVPEWLLLHVRSDLPAIAY